LHQVIFLVAIFRWRKKDRDVGTEKEGSQIQRGYNEIERKIQGLRGRKTVNEDGGEDGNLGIERENETSEISVVKMVEF